MTTDLEEETEAPPTPEPDDTESDPGFDHTETDTEPEDETIPWRPGMCVTPDCGHPVPDDATYCAPCQILFGSYADLLTHVDVQEWAPAATEPEAETTPEPPAGDCPQD